MNQGDVRVVMDSHAIAAMLTAPRGFVAADLLRRGRRVESLAKQYATGYAGGPRVRTGRLRGSITTHLVTEGGQVACYVGTNVEYAPFVEFGTSRAKPYPFLRPALRAAR